MVNLKIFTLISLISLSLFSAHLEAKPIYKWKDTNGNVQYSQTKPPKGVEFTVLNYRQSTASTSSSKSNANSSAPVMSKEDEILAKQAAEQQKVDAQQGDINKKNCKISQTNLKVLETKSRIQIEENGERRMLTDKERADRLASAKENVEKFCNK